MQVERINVLGVGISVLNLDSAAGAILNRVQEGEKGYVCVTGVHGVVEAHRDPEFLSILNRAFLCTPDGVPLVWFGRYHYASESMDRVYGPDLMWRLFNDRNTKDLRHFFFGGKPGVADLLKERMLAHFPKANIVGTHCPPFRPLSKEELAATLEEINAVKPDLIWVGLSTPKQEKFHGHGPWAAQLRVS